MSPFSDLLWSDYRLWCHQQRLLCFWETQGSGAMWASKWICTCLVLKSQQVHFLGWIPPHRGCEHYSEFLTEKLFSGTISNILPMNLYELSQWTPWQQTVIMLQAIPITPYQDPCSKFTGDYQVLSEQLCNECLIHIKVCKDYDIKTSCKTCKLSFYSNLQKLPTSSTNSMQEILRQT